jgi:toxin-antitoxin system PIN domain toxin
MKRGVDTNVLVYAHMPACEQHARAREFVERILGDADATLVITPAVLHELVHVVTDPRRFDPPVSMPEATAIARIYLGRTNVECVATDAHAAAHALDLIDRHRLGRRRLADSLFAATLLRHGVTELITCNAADFAAFEGLETIDPLAGAA